MLLLYNFFPFLYLFLLSEAIINFYPKTEDSLVLLHVLFRHGNRTPRENSQFPTDPNGNVSYKPFGFGQLTNKGKKTEYDLGKYLRKAYNGFIPKQYTPDVAYALSTNCKRTKASLNLVLTALFPPLITDYFAYNIGWQPIPYNVEQGHQVLGLPQIYCASYVQQYYKYTQTPEAKAIIANYKDLYQNLSKFTGRDIQTPEDISTVYTVLKSEDDFGLKLPQWTFHVYPKILENAAAVYYEFCSATTGMKRLLAGDLLKKILDDSFSKKNGALTEERKIFLYAAHEFNIAGMLRALNVYYRHVPPYGAAIFFEIHNISGVYGLKLYYQNYSNENPKLLTIPGCQSFCELEKFYHLVEDNLPGAMDKCYFFGELN